MLGLFSGLLTVKSERLSERVGMDDDNDADQRPWKGTREKRTHRKVLFVCSLT